MQQYILIGCLIPDLAAELYFIPDSASRKEAVWVNPVPATGLRRPGSWYRVGTVYGAWIGLSSNQSRIAQISACDTQKHTLATEVEHNDRELIFIG
jgi:hypothetical protein